jgi:hypothetical protein
MYSSLTNDNNCFFWILLLGDPTKEFLAKVWSQMGDLHVKEHGEEKKLFHLMHHVLVPASNETIDNSKTAVKKMYRAFGRILAYCILHEEKIANHVMVNQFC